MRKQFDVQKTLQQNMNVPMGKGNDAVFANLFALQMEVAEAINEIAWRPWKPEKHIDVYALLQEMADCQQFIINIVNELGMSYDQFISVLDEKQQMTQDRYGD